MMAAMRDERTCVLDNLQVLTKRGLSRHAHDDDEKGSEADPEKGKILALLALYRLGRQSGFALAEAEALSQAVAAF